MIKDLTTVTVIALVAISGLISCAPVKKFAKKNDVAMVAVVTKADAEAVAKAEKKDAMSFLNPRTGDLIPTCAQRAETPDPCKTRIVLPQKEGEVPILVDAITGKPIANAELTTNVPLIWFRFPGSHCETSYVGGRQIERCYPW